VAGALEGSDPARLTVKGIGAGAASANGNNKGRANKVYLPTIGGVSNSAGAMAAQVDLEIN